MSVCSKIYTLFGGRQNSDAFISTLAAKMDAAHKYSLHFLCNTSCVGFNGQFFSIRYLHYGIRIHLSQYMFKNTLMRV